MTTYFVRINNKDEYNRAVELLKSKSKEVTTVDDYNEFCEVLWSDGEEIGTFSRYDLYVNSYGEFETELFLEDKKDGNEGLAEVSVPKFKVGDTIECISDEWDYITKGNYYEVLKVINAYEIIIETNRGFELCYPIEDFVLVNETKVVAEITEEIISTQNAFVKVLAEQSEDVQHIAIGTDDVYKTVTDLLKSLTTSDNCFITFEKGKMIVVDTIDYLSYNVNSVEEAIVVAQKIDDLRVIEDELKELRGE